MKYLKHLDERTVMFIDVKVAVDELSSLQTVQLEHLSKGNPEYINNSAPFRLEFNKITCITLAYILDNAIRIKQLQGDEEDILNQLLPLITERTLIGYNIKQFIIPTIRFKLIKYNIDVPYYLDERGLKPWEIGIEEKSKLVIIDTEDFITGNVYGYLSLHSLCCALNIDFKPYTEDFVDNSYKDIQSIIKLYYKSLNRDFRQLTINLSTETYDTKVVDKVTILEEVYKSKIITHRVLDKLKPIYKRLNEKERELFKEIVLAASSNNGNKDYFYGGDTEIDTNIKINILKTIDE